VRLFTVETGREVRRWQAGKPFANTLAFGPDGRRALVGMVELP
jgi:hypothetical protein